MNTPNAITRDFKISDDSMLQDSRTTQALFKDDQATFQAFDADFKTPFETQWQKAIADAENAPTDEQILDVQGTLTTNVETALNDCGKCFQDAKYFIKKAFPNQTGIWDEFGFDNYEDARKNPDRMITFMNVFSTTANDTKYNTNLVAAGFDQKKIDDILAKRKALIDAKTAQEVAKNSRLGTTQSRIALMNTVWTFRTKVAEAAKNIYQDDFAKYKAYLLPASAEGTGVFSIQGTVIDKATGDKLENVTVSYGTAPNDVTTDSNGEYGFAKLTNGNYTLSFSLATYKPITKTVDFKGDTLVVDMELEKE
jgi:hypothetical protein